MVLPEAASLFRLLGLLAVSAGLFTALGCTASFSGLLVLDASCLGSDGAGGLVRFAGLGAAGLLPAAALEASATLATALGLSTAPWLDRTLEDKLLVAGVELGVSLRSTRGATLGVEEGGEETEVAAPLAGVAWPGDTEFESGMAVAGRAILEVSVVVSLVGLF